MSVPTIISVQAFPHIFPASWELKTKKNRTLYVRYKSGVLHCSYNEIKGDNPPAFYVKKVGEQYSNYMSTERMLDTIGFNMCMRKGKDADV